MKAKKRALVSLTVIGALLSNSQGQGFVLTSRLLLNGSLHSYDQTELAPPNYAQMMRRYEVERRLYRTKSYLISGGEYVAKSMLTVGSTLMASTSPLVAALGGQIVGDAISALGDRERNIIYSEMSERLNQGLKETVLYDSQINLKELTGQPREKALQLITKYPEIFDFKYPPGVLQSEKDLIQEAAIQVLADKVASNNFELELQKLEAQALEEGLEKVKKIQKDHDLLLRGHVKGYIKFRKTVTESLASIAKNSQLIVDRVQTNSGNISTNKEQIQLLQSSLFDKMSGKDQLDALKRGWFPDLTQSQRETQKHIAEATAKIESAVQNIQIAANNLPAAVSLFTKDTKTIEDVTKLSQVATGVISVIQASTMGPFAAVMTGLGLIGGLFGNGRNRTDEAKYNQQMMLKFEQVIDNQIKLSNQIDEVYRSLAEGQNKIYKLLYQSAMELVNLGQRLDFYHHQQMKELGLIKSYSLANMDLLRDIAGEESSKCMIFFENQRQEASDIRFIDRFSSYHQMRDHFNSHRDVFRPCQLGLTYILTKQTQDEDIHSLLLMKSYADRSNEVDSYWATREIYQPALAFYEEHKTKSNPSGYPELIHTGALRHYVNLAIELYPYLLILEDPEEPKVAESYEKHRISPFIIRRVKYLLRGALTLVDEAILQQEIISGHGWRESLAQELLGLGKSDRNDALRALIELNPILQPNFSRLLVEMRAKETISPLSYYDSLMSGIESYPFFEIFFGERIFPEYRENHWQVNLGLENEKGALRIDLPDSESVILNKWNYTADLVTLHELRARLVDHLALVSAM